MSEPRSDSSAVPDADCTIPHRQALLALILADQRKHWRQGDPVRVEDFLAQQPALSTDRDCVLDLIHHEMELREEAGDRVQVNEYQQRFPHLADELAQQFEIDHSPIAPLSTERSSRRNALERAATKSGDSANALPVVPGFEVLDVLGRGGVGVVYKARQVSLNRLVALKMILAGVHAGPDVLARFRTEAETVARLQHPNIVQVYEVGAYDNQPYMALEFIEGNVLKNLAGSSLPPRQAAQWVETLARAVHHAHQRGIMHRDLKPANVLLNRDGVLKITDFGMAKMMAGPGPNQTMSGDILGTPSYMAPEQAGGKAGQIGPTADVYGLGAVLYELLTGRPPFRAETTAETLEQVRFQDPKPPSRLRPTVPRDLEIICLRCLQKEPAKRYATAEALADDVGAFLAGEPIWARPPSYRERLASWTRRRPAEAALLGAAGMVLIGVIVGIIWSHALAAGAVAGLGLLAVSSWYSAKLRRALRETARQQVRAERYVEKLHLLLEMNRHLVETTNRDELLRLLAENTVRLANAELATIYLVDHDRGELRSKVTLDKSVGEIRLPIGVGIAGSVAASGEPINIPDAYADPRFNPEVDRRTGHKTNNLLTMPMTARDGRVIGVFQVMNKQDGAFGVEDIETLSSLASSAAIAVEHAV
jgi:serine/threonine-protein kinase